jgi:hypothetical protein
MPIHDWTRVTAGTWHDFHVAWIAEIRLALNDGLLPPSYYAQAEQIAGPMGPDVLTLQTSEPADEPVIEGCGGLAVATAPPRVKLVAEAEIDDYARKRHTLVIRHASGDRIVALIEIVSPGNKSTRYALEGFVSKAVEALYRGFHLLIVDLFPPTPRDPRGLPSVIWESFSGVVLEMPQEGSLTLSAFSAGWLKRVYVEGTGVGRELIEMPLFLEPEIYINVPLEETYRLAYRGVPQRWKRVLEGDG